MIYGGPLRPVIGQRIPHDDLHLGQGYTERTKLISRYFKEEYEKWRLQLEDVDYFIGKINLAYLYKGDDIQHAVKVSLAKWKTVFYNLNQQQLVHGDIVHLSDSYGELDYLLSLQQGRRKVIGHIADDDKRTVAESIYWRQKRAVNFTSDWQSAPVLLISKAVTAAEAAQIPLDFYETIININNENNLDYTSSHGFRKKMTNGIEVYLRV